MNLTHLKFAIEVERTGSITEAAGNLYITQPSLSKAIRELENDVGFVIFERTPRGVVATQKGLALLKHAREMQKQEMAIKALASGIDIDKREFVIAVPHGDYISEGITRYVSSLSGDKSTTVDIKNMDITQSIDAMSKGEIMLGIIRYSAAEEVYIQGILKKKSIRIENIWEFKRVLVVSEACVLAYAHEVCLNDMSQFIEIKSGDTRDGDIAPRHMLISDRLMQLEVLSAMPNAYMWSSPMKPDQLSRFSLVQRSVQGDLQTFRDSLICLSDHNFSDSDKSFINKLFEARNQLAF